VKTVLAPPFCETDEEAALKRAELIVSGAFFLIALIVIVDSVRNGIGWVPQQGPSAGLVPFYLALLLGVSSGFIFIVNLRKADTGKTFFTSVLGRAEAIRIFFTASLLTIGIVWMGIYIPSFLFSVLFARWLGKHRWVSTIAFAAILTIAIFLGMEKGLKLPLPKSFLYQKGLFFF
jgi:hypothetical protein